MNQKISIGINVFKEYTSFNNREKMCYDSLLKLKNIENNINLYSISQQNTQIEIPEFTSLPKLKTSFLDDDKTLPYVNEIFDVLSDTECDYFIFINSDVLISNRFIKHIKKTQKDCYPATKLHFLKLDSIDDKNSQPESVSVHGFDGFGIKKQWWINNKNRFKQMILGRAYWDTYFFVKCMLYGDCEVLNKPPLCLFHLDHKSISMENNKGNKENESNFVSDIDNVNQKWFSYVYNVLLKRETYNNILWFVPFTNEDILEKQYFKK